MKQLFIALCIIAIGANSVFAQDKNAPVFKFEKGTMHDFGTIPEGPKATHYFEFTNAGKTPLIIQNVSASCGCTTPEWPKQPILPGKKGQIKVIYDTQGRVGPFTKDIYIQSNAMSEDGKERFELQIKGTVKEKEAVKS